MLQCPACYGRGLIAHRDGSDTMYVAFMLALLSSYDMIIGHNVVSCSKY